MSPCPQVRMSIRAFEVRAVDHDAQEPVLAYWIVRGPHLKRHVVIGAKIYCLDVAPSPEIPEVDPMAILVREQILRHDPVLELRRPRPLARHHVVARQVPPEVIVQVLGPLHASPKLAMKAWGRHFPGASP